MTKRRDISVDAWRAPDTVTGLIDALQRLKDKDPGISYELEVEDEGFYQPCFVPKISFYTVLSYHEVVGLLGL